MCDTAYQTPVSLDTQQKPFPPGGAFVFQMETTLSRFLEMVGVLFDGIELLGLCPVGDYNIDLLKALDRKMYQYPIGAIFPYAPIAPTLPDGFVKCDGTFYYKAQYQDAFNFFLGSESLSPGFFVPDLRGRFLLGADSTHEPGDKAGAATATLDIANLPVHPHGYFYPSVGGKRWAANGTAFEALTDVPATLPTGDILDGGGQPVLQAEPIDILPPFFALDFIIFLGS